MSENVPDRPGVPDRPTDHLVAAAGYLSSALDLIDRLGEFFQAEHVWVHSQDWGDQDWPEKVNIKLDQLSFTIPEMYETLIHLAHGLQSVILEIGAIGEVGGVGEGHVP